MKCYEMQHHPMKCIIRWMVLQISIANSTHQGDRRNLFSLKGLDGFHWKKKKQKMLLGVTSALY